MSPSLITANPTQRLIKLFPNKLIEATFHEMELNKDVVVALAGNYHVAKPLLYVFY